MKPIKHTGTKGKMTRAQHKLLEKMIPDFLDDRLSNASMEQFLYHLGTCNDCKEELSTQFLVKAGVPKLETGEPFNLEKELAGYISLEKIRLRRRERLTACAYIIELLTVILFAVAAVTAVMLIA